MPAILLLMSEEPTWLRQQNAKWWQHWAWYIMREVRLNLMGEENDLKAALLRLLRERAADAVRNELVRLARRPDGELMLSTILRELEGIPDSQLDEQFTGLVASEALTGKRLSLIMMFILNRNPECAVPTCIRLLDLPDNAPSGPAVLAARALLEEKPVEVWSKLLRFFRRRRALAEAAIGQFVYNERRHHRDVANVLGEKRVGELLEIMFSLFPPESDPRDEGFHAVGQRERAAEMRDQLIGWLGGRGNEPALTALRRLERKYGKRYPWLRRPRAEAERRHRLSRWQPVPPMAAAQILANKNLRLLRSAQDVLDGISEALIQYERRLHASSPPAIEDLWNTPRGAPPSPKEEERVSDKICEVIREAFTGFAVAASREAQIRRRLIRRTSGGTRGSNADVVVTVPAVGAASEHAIVTPIEVKRACNRQARTGLRAQLVDRYIPELGSSHGAFIVAYLAAPRLRPAHKPIWRTIAAARKELAQQARAIFTETVGAIQVVALVLDARLDKPKKRRAVGKGPDRAKRMIRKAKSAKATSKTTRRARKKGRPSA